MYYYGSFVLQCYVLRKCVMTSTVGGNLTNRPPALRHIHVKTRYCYPSELEKTLCKWDIYVPLVTKGLKVT